MVANQGSCSIHKGHSLAALARCESDGAGSTLDALFHLVLTQSNQGSTNLETLTGKK